MKKIDVELVDGSNKKEIVYNVYDFPFEILYEFETCRKKRITYYNVSAAFDIESTTIESENPYAFMYQWQLCICNKVVFGRTWEEFTLFLDLLRENFELSYYKRLVIYVHNLAYEFQFMKDFIDIDELFAKDKRKLIKLLSKGIEFRCSYFLSNMSLYNFCKNSDLCKHYKLEDEYDYRKLRTPKTILTNKELSYCYNDVRGLCECIDTKLQDDTIATIPLTSTGYVRRDCRAVMQTETLRKEFVEMRLKAEQYTLLRKIFRGGNTHANRMYANEIINNVHSFDLQSSYPAWIMLDDYPMSEFVDCDIKNIEELLMLCNKYAVCMTITLLDLAVNKNTAVPYIDIAHCERHKSIEGDNGRVLKAEAVTISITEIDLIIIMKTYTFSNIVVHKAMYAIKAKIQRELRCVVMDYYAKKTQLKGIVGMEYEYMKSKNKLNAIFGMMVTDIIHNDISYDGKEWLIEKGDLEESLERYYNSRNSFLSYQHGVYVTANARKHLQDMLDIVGNDVVYCDTDSIKFINDKHLQEFENMNSYTMERIKNADIKPYATKDGKRYYMGIWEYEGKSDYFKTLGAKKYCTVKENKFEVTVSGMHKIKGAKSVKNIENFEIGNTYHDVGRTVSYYNDEKPHNITIDGVTFTTASNIGVVDTTYTLGITNEYWELLIKSKKVVDKKVKRLYNRHINKIKQINGGYCNE